FNKTLDELETRFDKWLFVIKNLNRLDRVPDKLRERIFERLFEVAEIAKFNRDELLSYEDSLKYYRDLKNSLDTAFEEGEIAKATEVILRGHAEGLSVTMLAKLTGLSEAVVQKIISRSN
ncbi:PD-(D/E)XK nuclease family transposase, partial [Rhodoflexus sp.]